MVAELELIVTLGLGIAGAIVIPLALWLSNVKAKLEIISIDINGLRSCLQKHIERSEQAEDKSELISERVAVLDSRMSALDSRVLVLESKRNS